MSIATQEQKYEQSLTTNVLVDIAIVFGVYTIFPIIRVAFPHLYAPQEFLSTERKSIPQKAFWYINVFQQPLTVYAQRGNMATIFAVFSTMMIVLYFVLGILSLTILFPLYYFGTDQSWNTNYLTFWSMGTISHLTYNSPMNFIPMIMLIIFSMIIMIFYGQFAVIFSSFRQRCLRRRIYSNYAVLLQNIPGVVNEKRELHQMLKPYKDVIKSIVPIPRESYYLAKLNKQYLRGQNKMEQLCLETQLARARYYNIVGLTMGLQEKQQAGEVVDLVKLKQYEEKCKVLEKLVEDSTQKQKQLQERQDDILIQIREVAYRDITDISQVFRALKQVPVRLPSSLTQCFEYTNMKQCITENKLNKDIEIYPQFAPERIFELHRKHYVQTPEAKKAMADTYSGHDDTYVEQIGTGAFLICTSQQAAATTCASVLNANSAEPSIIMAPPIQEINWTCVGMSAGSKVIRMSLFGVLYIVMFFMYIFGFTYFLSLIHGITETEMFQFFCNSSKCTFNDPNATTTCKFCSQISGMVLTMIPTICIVLVNTLIPMLIHWLVRLINVPTLSAEQNIEYRLLFIFLLLVVGIVQIIFPSLANQTTGELNLNIFDGINVNQMLYNLGTNIVNQQFYFISYLISKYFTFPLFSLVNIKNLFFFILGKILKKNSFESIKPFKYTEFNYVREFAYMSHMFVLALIFSISAPMVNIIAFVIFCGMSVIDRYLLLMVATPGLVADFSSQSRILMHMVTDLFTGLILMIIALGAYYYNQVGIIYTIGFVTCVIMLIISILVKWKIDKKYYRSTEQLAIGDYTDCKVLFINPEHKPDPYEPSENFSCKFNMRRDKDLKFLEQRGLLKNGTYKMRPLDKLLRFVYNDLSKLPTSYINFDDLQLTHMQRRCRVLGDQQLQIEEQSDSDADQCAVAFTHPAFIQVVKEMSKARMRQ